MSVLSQEYLRRVLELVDATALLRLINYRLDKIESIGADQYRGFCPIHKETIFRTLIVDNINKTYECTYNFCPGHQGGDFVDLYARALGLQPAQAVAELIEHLHLPIEPPQVLPSKDKALEVARNLLELNANDEAVEAYRSILERDPFDVEAHEGLAQAFSRKGDVEAAVAELEVLLGIHQGKADLRHIVRVASRLVALLPDEPDHYYTLIDALDKLHLDGELIEQQQRLVELFDRLGRSQDATDLRLELEDRGLVSLDSSLKIIGGLIALGRLDEAREKALYRVRRFEAGGDLEAANACAMLLIEHGLADRDLRQRFYSDVQRTGLSADQLQRCLDGFQRFLAAGELDDAAELLDGIERRARGNLRYLEARADLAAARGDASDAEGLRLQVIDRLIHDDRIHDAALMIDDILGVDPGRVEALERQVTIYEKLGDDQQATEVCWQIVDALKKQGRTAELLRVYERLTFFDPDNATLREDFIGALADSGRRREAALAAVMFAEEMIEQGREEEAIGRLEALSERLRAVPEVLLKLAELRLARGEREEAARLFGRAAEARLGEKRHPEALLLLHRAVDADPNTPHYHEQLAETLMANDRAEEATIAFRRLAEAYLEAGDTASAERVMERVFELSPEDTTSLRVMARIFGSRQEEGREIEALLRLGRMCFEKREYGRCLDVIEEILRLDPDSIPALELKIDALERSNRLSHAIATCLDLAETLLTRGEAPLAEPLLRRAIELDPTTIAAREKLTDILLKDARHEEAIELGLDLLACYRRARTFEPARRLVGALTEIAPSHVGLREAALDLSRDEGETAAVIEQANALIAIHREAGDLARAADLFRTLLELRPEDLDLRINYVSLLRDLGDTREFSVQGLRAARLLRTADRQQEAVAFYGEVAAADPANEAASLELAELHAEMGRPDQAAAIYRRLVDRLREAHDDRGAAAMLQRAIRVDKRNPELRRMLIDIALEEQQIDEAITGFIHLYELFRSQEQHARALDTIEEAIGIKPDNIALRRYRADEMRALGRETEADRTELELVDLYAGRGELDLAEDMLTTLAHRADPPAGLDQARRKIEDLRRAASADSPTDSTKPGASRRGSRPNKRLATDSESDAGGSPAGEPRRAGPGREPVRLALVEDYVFESFIVGDENQFAYATSLAVSKSPGKQYNPLFIYGDVGMGKTHLINAIGLAISRAMPDQTILYTGTEEFVMHLVEAIQTNTVSSFRNAHRATDVLLVDDIQFLSAKERAQEEFFHVFNALFQAGKQIVLTSDRPPKDIARLEERLTTRFGAGIIVEMRRPGIETRMAIVKAEMARRKVEVDHRIVEAIAHRLDGSIRELKGAVNQLCALADISGKPMTVESANRAIDAVTARGASSR